MINLQDFSPEDISYSSIVPDGTSVKTAGYIYLIFEKDQEAVEIAENLKIDYQNE